MGADLPRVRLGLERAERMLLHLARYWFAIHEPTGNLLMVEEPEAALPRSE